MWQSKCKLCLGALSLVCETSHRHGHLDIWECDTCGAIRFNDAYFQKLDQEKVNADWGKKCVKYWKKNPRGEG